MRTRSEEQVSRYALRWVDDEGHVRRKTNVKNTGRWADDEHERFIEVCTYRPGNNIFALRR